MEKLPLSVVISALIKDNKILLIKRVRGDYVNLWGLPGGKIEKEEHLSEAAEREIFEETGIESSFKSYLALLSEHLIENDKILQHFLLHICELEPKATDIDYSGGKLAWFDFESLERMKDKIIPSDFLIIEKIVKNRERGYYNCVLEKIGNKYLLKKFKKC